MHGLSDMFRAYLPNRSDIIYAICAIIVLLFDPKPLIAKEREAAFIGMRRKAAEDRGKRIGRTRTGIFKDEEDASGHRSSDEAIE